MSATNWAGGRVVSYDISAAHLHQHAPVPDVRRVVAGHLPRVEQQLGELALLGQEKQNHLFHLMLGLVFGLGRARGVMVTIISTWANGSIILYYIHLVLLIDAYSIR